MESISQFNIVIVLYSTVQCSFLALSVDDISGTTSIEVIQYNGWPC